MAYTRRPRRIARRRPMRKRVTRRHTYKRKRTVGVRRKRSARGVLRGRGEYYPPNYKYTWKSKPIHQIQWYNDNDWLHDIQPYQKKDHTPDLEVHGNYKPNKEMITNQIGKRHYHGPHTIGGPKLLPYRLPAKHQSFAERLQQQAEEQMAYAVTGLGTNLILKPLAAGIASLVTGIDFPTTLGFMSTLDITPFIHDIKAHHLTDMLRVKEIAKSFPPLEAFTKQEEDEAESKREYFWNFAKKVQKVVPKFGLKSAASIIDEDIRLHERDPDIKPEEEAKLMQEILDDEKNIAQEMRPIDDVWDTSNNVAYGPLNQNLGINWQATLQRYQRDQERERQRFHHDPDYYAQGQVQDTDWAEVIPGSMPPQYGDPLRDPNYDDPVSNNTGEVPSQVPLEPTQPTARGTNGPATQSYTSARGTSGPATQAHTDSLPPQYDPHRKPPSRLDDGEL